MKEQVRQPVGWLKTLISILSISLAVCNLVILESKGKDLLSNMLLWLPFVVVSISVLFIDIKTVVFVACLYAGTLTAINQTNKGDIQAVLFFILALNIYSDKISLIVVVFSALTGILGRAFLIGMSFTETTILTIGFFACFLIFYIPKIIKGDQDV